MRLSRIVVVASILLVSSPAFAQGWIEYRDQSERFGVTLPGEPAIQEITYTSWRGAMLSARVYTVEDGVSRYSVTVVNYAPDEDVTDVNGSVAYEAWRIRRRGGDITFDAYAAADYVEGHELYIANTDESRILMGIFLYAKRLYILKAAVPRGAAAIAVAAAPVISILRRTGSITVLPAGLGVIFAWRVENSTTTGWL